MERDTRQASLDRECSGWAKQCLVRRCIDCFVVWAAAADRDVVARVARWHSPVGCMLEARSAVRLSEAHSSVGLAASVVGVDSTAAPCQWPDLGMPACVAPACPVLRSVVVQPQVADTLSDLVVEASWEAALHHRMAAESIVVGCSLLLAVTRFG